MTPATSSSSPPADGLAEQLGQALSGRAKRVLVVKALPEEQFAGVLSAIQRALPGASLTCLVAEGSLGAADEVGEVLRRDMGFRALWGGLRRGFDICIIAASPAGAAGWRGFAADLAALASRAKDKLLCSQTRILSRRGRLSILFAPLFSGLGLAVGLLLTVFWAAISTVIIAAAVGIGELLRRAVHPAQIRGTRIPGRRW